MQLNFFKFLEVVFPLSDDERSLAPCTPTLFTNKLFPVYRNDICSLAVFSDVQVRSAIHLVKFHNHPKAVQLLGSLLTAWLLLLPKDEYLIVPIPLSSKRLKKRGHNQVESIARIACKNTPHVQLCTNVLQRNRHTPPQTSLTKKDREVNLVGAFTVVHVEAIRGKHVILLDDVSTTGATLQEAKSVLCAHKPLSLRCVALAH